MYSRCPQAQIASLYNYGVAEAEPEDTIPTIQDGVAEARTVQEQYLSFPDNKLQLSSVGREVVARAVPRLVRVVRAGTTVVPKVARPDRGVVLARAVAVAVRAASS